MPSALPLDLRRQLCASCYKQWSQSLAPTRTQRMGLQGSNRIQRRYKGYIAAPGEQARPITGFYAGLSSLHSGKSLWIEEAFILNCTIELLYNPLRSVAPATRTVPEPPLPESLPKTTKEETIEKARIVFGSKLAGPGERKAAIDAKSQEIAGVLVPPRPTEPDNCCMSGCVNCVWDMYRDDMEEWAAKSAEARLALQAQRKEKQTGAKNVKVGAPSHVLISMDDDGGGSETNWAPEVSQDKLFDDIPVGIREFMRTEKKLRQKHQEEQALSN
ncbi:hypothetical protein BU24DRAFT_196287 [Aaosphaeria arxii CBS 175.79]|uniref:Oxidoreductase-like domain-containing protein n=1 Tax=Aaosphaeria arxii CBS 175.79 TaxID=1450172 RepID=A0A6A5XS70_9PLEO|nr:uncharacterized protein BU24DRAFT_196287 [Aaosphaeria arxii CBS 175.79]KAF2016185.1 hypothetical protein BU24DRAFT_196287 [Aaosphaeria arxii CBS 175.79]